MGQANPDRRLWTKEQKLDRSDQADVNCFGTEAHWGTAKRRTYRLVPRNPGSGAPLQDGQQARATHEAEHVKIMRTIGRFEATQSAPGMSDRVSRGANT
jgi:hypothetical protein